MENNTRPKAVTFIDGQNLYHTAKALFGRRDPDYDVMGLSRFVCSELGLQCSEVRFYSGIPEKAHKPDWHQYWSQKTRGMLRNGVKVFIRRLRRRDDQAYDQFGNSKKVFFYEEKGIDVRIALDLVRMARDGEFEAAVIFSQDQDLAEAVTEIQHISKKYGKKISVYSAFPDGPGSDNHRGINGTTFFRIDQSDYERYLDTWDYWRHIRRLSSL